MAKFTVIRSHDYGLVDRGMLKDPSLSLQEKAIITCFEALKKEDCAEHAAFAKIVALSEKELEKALRSILGKGYLIEYLREEEVA